MANRVVPSFFSRIILITVIFVTIGAGLYVGSLLLEPVEVPIPTPTKAAVKFDVRSDVSKNPVFLTLQPMGPSEIVPGQLGRVNPFAEVPPTPTSTPIVPTSTVEVVPVPVTTAPPTTTTQTSTGTLPVIEIPPAPASP